MSGKLVHIVGNLRFRLCITLCLFFYSRFSIKKIFGSYNLYKNLKIWHWKLRSVNYFNLRTTKNINFNNFHIFFYWWHHWPLFYRSTYNSLQFLLIFFVHWKQDLTCHCRIWTSGTKYKHLITPYCFFFAIRLCSDTQNTSLYHKTWSPKTRVSM